MQNIYRAASVEFASDMIALRHGHYSQLTRKCATAMCPALALLLLLLLLLVVCHGCCAAVRGGRRWCVVCRRRAHSPATTGGEQIRQLLHVWIGMPCCQLHTRSALALQFICLTIDEGGSKYAGAAAMPSHLKHACLLHVSHYVCARVRLQGEHGQPAQIEVSIGSLAHSPPLYCLCCATLHHDILTSLGCP
jgi:hypothetical protein